MTDARRLVALGFAPELAKELAKISGGGLQIGTTGTTAMAGNRHPTKTIRGGVFEQEAIADLSADASADEIVDCVNAILAALRSAGVINS